MNRDIPDGPSESDTWISRTIDGGDMFPPILALADASNEDRQVAGIEPIFYVLPKHPLLARDADNKPKFQISLVLTRSPKTDESSIYDLVKSASFTADFSIAIPERMLGRGDRPLFASEATFALYADHAPPNSPSLAEMTGGGANVRVGLAGHLNEDQAKAVLLAINGMQSGLTLSCLVRYRTSPTTKNVDIGLSWVTFFDAVKLNQPRNEIFDRRYLVQCVAKLLQDEVITAKISEESLGERRAQGRDAEAVLAVILKVSGMVLERLDPGLASDDESNTYKLLSRPNPSSRLAIKLSVTTVGIDELKLGAPLESIFLNALDREKSDEFIHLISYDPTGVAGTREVPSRVQLNFRSKDAGQRAGPLMIQKQGRLVSMEAILSPETAKSPNALMLMNSDMIRHHGGNAWLLENSLVVDAGLNFANGQPIVVEPNNTLFPDGRFANRWWYKPTFRLILDTAAELETSPFQFQFREIAGHDSRGQNILEGQVLFTFAKEVDPAAEEKQNEGVQILPISTSGLTVTLSLPVRDENGTARDISLQANIEETDGLIHARFGLLNEYVRVAYGDLAIDGFQEKRARLSIRYTYNALVPNDNPIYELPMEAKLQVAPIAYNKLQAATLQRRGAFFDVGTFAYRAGDNEVTFHREMADASLNTPAMRGAEMVLLQAIRPQAQLTAIMPHLIANDLAISRPVVHSYKAQTLVTVDEFEAFVPCTSFGMFYRQDFGDRKQSIGCSSSFSLGQAPLKLYQELDQGEYSSPFCRVYRSLLQPGRFVVLPNAYKITRYEPTDVERAYRPAVYMYSSLDASSQAQNRCVVMAALQPAIPSWVRRDLTERLKKLSHLPVIAFATEIESELEYIWQVSNGTAIECQAAKLWDSFQVTLSTDLAGGLQIQSMLVNSGISAHVDFKLPDGTKLGPGTSLVLDLKDIVGPFDAGPLSHDITNSTVSLTNHIESALNISDIDVYSTSSLPSRVRVDQSVMPAGTITIALPAQANEAYPIYLQQLGNAADLTEITSFIEDIRTNIIFANLINYANHELKQLDVKVRLAGVNGSEKDLIISEELPVAEENYILPLTSYLALHTAQFQVVKTSISGSTSSTGWIDWDLKTKGNVISLTWDLIK